MLSPYPSLRSPSFPTDASPKSCRQESGRANFPVRRTYRRGKALYPVGHRLDARQGLPRFVLPCYPLQRPNQGPRRAPKLTIHIQCTPTVATYQSLRSWWQHQLVTQLSIRFLETSFELQAPSQVRSRYHSWPGVPSVIIPVTPWTRRVAALSVHCQVSPGCSLSISTYRKPLSCAQVHLSTGQPTA